MDYLEFIARVVSHLPDRGQAMVRYYANAHRGKVRKASRVPVVLGMIEEEARPIPSNGWADNSSSGTPAIRILTGTYPKNKR